MISKVIIYSQLQYKKLVSKQLEKQIESQVRRTLFSVQTAASFPG